MNRNGSRSTALVAGLVLAMPAFAAWKVVGEGESFTHAKSGYSIQYPPGWRWVKMPFGDETVATRDGVLLQRIYVDFRKHKKAFRALGKDSTPDMMPQELAEKLVAEIDTACNCQNMQVLSNEPATLAGRPGFRLHASYSSAVDAGSVRYQVIVYGANSPQGIFLVGYAGTVLHNFERDVATFEKSLATFTITDTVK